MLTIIEELSEIAGVCITSDEFVVRANSYLSDRKKIYQPLLRDNELRELFRKVSYQREVDRAWKLYKEVIKPALLKRPECSGLWYEVWIDLSEAWIDKWFSSFRYMDNKAIIEVCVKYLNEHERFYGSSDYTDMLNGMIKDCDFG